MNIFSNLTQFLVNWPWPKVKLRLTHFSTEHNKYPLWIEIPHNCLSELFNFLTAKIKLQI